METLFDPDKMEATMALPTGARQMARAAEMLAEAKASGRWTTTAALRLGEPWRTWFHMIEDGIGLTGNNTAVPFAQTPHELPPILLVGVAKTLGAGETNRVAPSVRQSVPVAGSDRMVVEKVNQNMGEFALVENSMPERAARVHLFRRGYGIRRDILHVEVVEWRWLERMISSGDVPIHGAKELHAAILDRHGTDPKFRAAAGLAPLITETKPATKEKGATL